jgi:hypothetical protein
MARGPEPPGAVMGRSSPAYLLLLSYSLPQNFLSIHIFRVASLNFVSCSSFKEHLIQHNMYLINICLMLFMQGAMH